MNDTISTNPFRARDLVFNREVRVITVHGRKASLDAGSSGVFAKLADHFGDCVSKDALLQAGWPRRLVHENSLAKAISKLRQAIDGSRIEIAAIYGVGYVLRDADEWHATAGATPSDVPAIAAARHRFSGLRPTLIASSLVLLVALLATVTLRGYSYTTPARHAPLVTNDAPNAVATVLWVDDHPSNNVREVAALRQRRVAVHLAQSTEDALKLLAINRYALVVSDLGRGDDRLAGLKLIEAMKRRGADVPVVIYTVRAKEPAGQVAQRRLVAESGAAGLAVTPEEIRAIIARRIAAIS